jgi:endonuclease YncB( thermonuclease family)
MLWSIVTFVRQTAQWYVTWRSGYGLACFVVQEYHRRHRATAAGSWWQEIIFRQILPSIIMSDHPDHRGKLPITSPRDGVTLSSALWQRLLDLARSHASLPPLSHSLWSSSTSPSSWSSAFISVASSLHASLLESSYSGWLIAAAACVGTLSGLRVQRWLTTRCRTAADIPPAWFKRRRRLRGIVTAVNDSDNVRVQHLTLWQRLLFFRRPRLDPLASGTINVRLAGIDAPELGHFGLGPKQEQPLAAEARQWLAHHTIGRDVIVELQRLDQYGRAVGVVYGPRRRWLGWGPLACLNVDMVRVGLACVYRQGGAEYGRHLEALERAEREARTTRRGLWAMADVVLPHDFKRQQRSS